MPTTGVARRGRRVLAQRSSGLRAGAGQAHRPGIRLRPPARGHPQAAAYLALGGTCSTTTPSSTRSSTRSSPTTPAMTCSSCRTTTSTVRTSGPDGRRGAAQRLSRSHQDQPRADRRQGGPGARPGGGRDGVRGDGEAGHQLAGGWRSADPAAHPNSNGAPGQQVPGPPGLELRHVHLQVGRGRLAGRTTVAANLVAGIGVPGPSRRTRR